MPQQLTQRRRSAGKDGDTVGRCCQRHAVTGQVMTDWYPTRINVKLIDNGCCRGFNHRVIRGTVRRRSGRRTISRASDNFSGQSGLLCTCTIRLDGPYNCNFRLIIGSEYTAKHPENWGPAPKRPIGWVVSPGTDRARNPPGTDTRGYKNACDIPSLSGGFPRYPNSFDSHQQRPEAGVQTQLSDSEQQNGGQPGENGMPRTTHSRRCRRQVLHPTHSIGQLAIRGTWSGGQNLTDWYTVSIKNSCDSRLLSVGSVTTASYTTISHTRSTTTRLTQSRHQRNGGDGGLLVGSGVQPTVWGRHPRRRVPAPGQSMNRGGFGGEWSGDQNPTDRYTVAVKIICDSHSQPSHSGPGTTPQSCHREVAR